MTHRRITSLLLVCIILISIVSVGVGAAEEKTPVVLLLPGTYGPSALVSDLDALEAVRGYMVGLGKVELMAFDPENPTIARFIMERKFGDDALAKIADPNTAKEIARLVGADYILTVHCEVLPELARLALRLIKTSGKGEWIGGAEAQIASGGGPQAAVNRKNAISTAASSALSQIDADAFGKLKPKADGPAPVVNPVDTPPVIVPVETPSTRDLVAEYTAHMNAAEQYSLRNDLLNVIYELRQAVDIEPKTVSIRLKLANAYAAVGMTEESVDELQRAQLFRPDDPAVLSALGEFYLANGALQKASEQLREAAKLDPSNVPVRVSLGNLLWNQNKLDEAIATFEEAAKIDPANGTPHERLYKLYLARKNFPLAIEHLIASKSGGKELDAAARYRIMGEVISTQLTTVLGKLDESWKEYQAQQVSREDYYRDTKDQGTRIDEFAAFLSTQTAPDGLKGAHAHGVLCASLLSQSASAMLSYLETDKQQYADEAALFREDAKTELGDFMKALGK